MIRVSSRNHWNLEDLELAAFTIQNVWRRSWPQWTGASGRQRLRASTTSSPASFGRQSFPEFCHGESQPMERTILMKT